ncbi:MFS transporter [Pseudooceanicola sp.]|uniref:MFS transporter n=1 Tax=Pseudooceanicola sp. TaxID=1914328 RepID=UPI002608BC6D|nr:MFS transporter [Pseudooceanicola sp.]MDF1855354.1 MFS transporter [Pseudooceanicola sp.]
MRKDIVLLGLAYVLSQFYRSFLSVLTVPLQRDLGATPEEMANASGLWFLFFALSQIPVGAMLDRIGPRRTAAWLLLFGGGGGAATFVVATAPWHISLGMALLGIGCAPVLMAAYYILAREYPPSRFSTYAGLIVGIGTTGSIFSSLPLVWAVDLFGWRGTMAVLAGLSIAAALGILVVVRDPARVTVEKHGSIFDILRIPAMWPILPLMTVCYLPAGGFRGVWTGPYLTEVYGADFATIGTVALILGVAVVAGTLAYGPGELVFRTRKWLAAVGVAIATLTCFALIVLPPSGIWQAAILIAALCFFSSCYSLLISHGRAFVPPHLIGRGVTLLNLCGMMGVGGSQLITGRIYAAEAAAGSSPAQTYDAIFLFYGVALALGLVAYLFSRDRLD